MKKIFSALMLMACLCLAIPAQAQLQFGVKAGLNVSKVSISKEVFNPDNRAGFFVGPTADLTLPLLGLGLDASVLYNQYGIDTEEGSTMKKSIEIPAVKIADGVISTAELVSQTLESATPATGDDAFQRIIKEKHDANILFLIQQANVRSSDLKKTKAFGQ